LSGRRSDYTKTSDRQIKHRGRFDHDGWLYGFYLIYARDFTPGKEAGAAGSADFSFT
jgi:hypothetical protein